MTYLDVFTWLSQQLRRVLYAGVDPADGEVAKALSILPGAEVAILVRIRLADNQVIALERSHIVYALCPAILEQHDFACESLYRVLRVQYGLHLAYAHQTIEAHVATGNEFKTLECKPGTPILKIVRVTYSEDRPIEYVLSVYRGDRYKFHTILREID